ncbi:MAG: amidohydrolase [Desulfobulbaceae bacterium]|uniref:Amidohydrolase n=1 Tax=Candidatus Desulfobia pelagia TaxID=2841692 RepID=A0A8J6NDK9_9BACT|nr:amidohydrolase [Candidatus Desulfobia pelagia]
MNLTPDDTLIAWMLDIRREIHQYPELAFEEKRTAGLICHKLDELGISYRKEVGGTGVVASLHADSQDTPCIALRADMDALPIEEKTGLPFASKIPGLMHACGHDGHVSMLLGAAALLKRIPNLPGKVVFLFQPAEENGGGAEKMIEAGALDGVNGIFSGHIDRHYNVGEISAQRGLICAFTDEFHITIRGKGGHAAKPHETIDCIVVASLLVMSIQTLVSREVNPSFPTVVTVGQITGGSAANVIADQAVLRGTIRTTHLDSREKIILGLQRMVRAMEDLYNAKATIELIPGYPPIINNPAAATIARTAARQTVGKEGLKKQPYPSLGGEDFSFYLHKVPGCMVRFGAKKDGLANVAAHSPRFDFNEDVLPIGAEFLARAAILALKDIKTLS